MHLDKDLLIIGLRSGRLSSDGLPIPLMSRLKKRIDAQAPLWTSLALGIGFWFISFWELHFEWEVNEQYNYGFFVPLLAAYLFFLRWEDRPMPQLALRHIPLNFCLALASFASYGVALFFLANVDWRLVHFAQGIVASSVCLLLIYKAGGKAWLYHFAFPILFLWIAIPWPHAIELNFISGLMDEVASSTVSILNLFGIYANQQGNAIILDKQAVNIAEACSGVRSFQSTLMGGLFLGEMFRLFLPLRLLLIIFACCFAFVFNIARTLLLTYLSNSQGMEALLSWHDPAGYLVFVGSFGFLFILSLLFKHLNKIKDTSSPTQSQRYAPQGISKKTAVIYLVLLALCLPTTYLWYAYRSQFIVLQPHWELNWAAAGPSLKLTPLEHSIEAILVCDKSERGQWNSPDGGSWVGYYMEWFSPEKGHIGGLHSPGHCLPSVGWQLVRRAKEIIWEKKGIRLVICPFEFSLKGATIYVFDIQWDPSGYPYHLVQGLRHYKDRFLDVWNGNRKKNKHTLEFVAQHYTSLKLATEEFIDFLDRAVILTPNPNS